MLNEKGAQAELVLHILFCAFLCPVISDLDIIEVRVRLNMGKVNITDRVVSHILTLCTFGSAADRHFVRLDSLSNVHVS